MTAFIRPSLILRMDLDERLFNDECVSDIKRSYSYVAPSLVQAHKPVDGQRPENVMRFMIKLHRAYWDKSDEAAQQLWEGVMPKWLHNMFSKVSNTITAANSVRAENGQPAFPYHWLELEFGENALIAVKTGSDSSFPGRWGGHGGARARPHERRCVWGRISPVCASRRAPATRRSSQPPSRRRRKGMLAAERGESAGQKDQQAVDVAAADEGEAVVAADQVADVADAAEPAFAMPELPAFDVDYGTWGIEYADGTVREFDAAAGAFS